MAWHRCFTWGALLPWPGVLCCNCLAQVPHLEQKSFAAMAWLRPLKWGALLQWPGTGAWPGVLCCDCLLLPACLLVPSTHALCTPSVLLA